MGEVTHPVVFTHGTGIFKKDEQSIVFGIERVKDIMEHKSMCNQIVTAPLFIRGSKMTLDEWSRAVENGQLHGVSTGLADEWCMFLLKIRRRQSRDCLRKIIVVTPDTPGLCADDTQVVRVCAYFESPYGCW